MFRQCANTAAIRAAQTATKLHPTSNFSSLAGKNFATTNFPSRTPTLPHSRFFSSSGGEGGYFAKWASRGVAGAGIGAACSFPFAGMVLTLGILEGHPVFGTMCAAEMMFNFAAVGGFIGGAGITFPAFGAYVLKNIVDEEKSPSCKM